MTVNLENSAVGTRLEKVSFQSNPKERQGQPCSKYRTIALTSHIQTIKLNLEKAEDPDLNLPTSV